MARYVYVVFSDAKPGREDEFNDWYTNTHTPDVVKANGFLTGQRFRYVGPNDGRPGLPGKYMAIYEMETDDPDRTLQELGKLLGTPALMMSDSFDENNMGHGVYKPMINPIRKKDMV